MAPPSPAYPPKKDLRPLPHGYDRVSAVDVRSQGSHLLRDDLLLSLSWRRHFPLFSGYLTCSLIKNTLRVWGSRQSSSEIYKRQLSSSLVLHYSGRLNY